MKKIEWLHDRWKSFVASLSVVLGVFLDRFVENVSLQYKFIFGIVLFALVIHMAEAILDALLNASRFLRELLFRHSFVEDKWAEVVLEKLEDQPGRILYVALVTIMFKEGQLHVSGSVHEANSGKPFGRFQSTRVIYDNEHLTYLYDAVATEATTHLKHGYGVLYFGGGGKQFNEYHGCFHDPDFPHPLCVYGERIDFVTGKSLVTTMNVKDYLLKFVAHCKEMKFEQSDVRKAA